MFVTQETKKLKLLAIATATGKMVIKLWKNKLYLVNLLNKLYVWIQAQGSKQFCC